MNHKAAQLARKANQLVASGQFRPAIPLYQQALEEDPGRADDWFNLAVSLRRTGEDEAALQAYDQALKNGVAGPEEVHLNRAVIQSDQLNRPQEALESLKAALEIRPSYTAALLNLGNLHEELGQAREAIQCYERLLGLPQPEPSHRARALARLAHLEPPDGGDSQAFSSLAQAAAQPGLDPATAASLYLALARAHDRVDQVAPAFEAMSRGKALLARTGPAYQSRQIDSKVDDLIQAFPDPLSASTEASDDRPKLVFILGLYRSGSSLVEQMLSAHPDVLTGGELDILPRLFGNPFTSDQSHLSRLGPQELEQFKTRYWQLLAQRFDRLEQARIITDKRLDNHFLVGLLARLFPQARFIHTTRQPIDNALSIFMQDLDTRWVPYANRLEDISHFSIQSRRLIDHWKKVLPGRLTECRYDRLVREPEPILRGLLDFLGLSWDPRCLNFHEQAGAVKTASYWQVRKPLYQKASGRWERYADHLEPLQKMLNPLLDSDDFRT